MPRAPKHCAHTGCEWVGTSKYCPPHTKQHQARASNSTRGYGTAHQQRRAALLPAAYGRPCPVCHYVMSEGQALHADHTTPLAQAPNGLADRIIHARCNESLGGQTRRSQQGGGGTPTPP